jgi:hypothetical protein
MDGYRLARMPLVALLLFVPSCRIPELRPGDPGPVMPDTFNGVTDTENSADVGFDEFFKDPILTSLIHQGLVGNQQLKILGEEIQIANNEILRRRGAIFPFVTLGTKAGLEKPSMFTQAVTSPLRCQILCLPQTSHGKLIFGGSCAMPGMQHHCVTSALRKAGITLSRDLSQKLQIIITV